MIHINKTEQVVTLSCKSRGVTLKPLPNATAASLEDAVSNVFKASGVGHQVRDFAVLKYKNGPTTIYAERSGSVVAIESECETSASFTCSLLGLKAVLLAAGVPCED